jgi:hypothetical protein
LSCLVANLKYNLIFDLPCPVYGCCATPVRGRLGNLPEKEKREKESEREKEE